MNEEEIFHEALARNLPAERATYLEQACAGNPALRAAVEALLRANVGASGFLGSPASSLDATREEPMTECSGTVIGSYKLIEQVGEGGMGSVWMAQQTEPVKRLVALKLIKAGMDSKQVIARFEAERQALALMDHPNIAKVLDGGTTASGRPYFVMDLVKGVPITRYCDEHYLTPRQRLELFVPICQAVQHAHQKGIIHRDIKPSNVLVAHYDGRPVPKVIDFGVAKAAGQPLTDKTLVTGFGVIVGTLEYMSPEQAEINQLDIDTRSDIYSLGVLLYELLVGSPPFTRKELEKAGMLEMLRIIREQEPSKPSTKLSTAEGLPTLAANRGTQPAMLTKLVRGELDLIVMKALEKDRNRRYETANGFAMDVQRYLADEPVQACPPSVGYRLRKFVRRNKVAIAFAGLFLIILLTLTGGFGWNLSARAARQSRVGAQVDLILIEVDRLEREQKWADALAAARRAEAAVSGGEADAATGERVRELLKELEFIERLEQIRMQRATSVDGNFDDAGADREYARAFREYGVNVEELAVEVSVGHLKSRPTLAIPLGASLDDWVFARREVSEDAAGWKRLVAVARGVDPEAMRDQLRSMWGQPVAEVQDQLRRLAESIDVRGQHPATLVTLAISLRRAKHSESAVRLLRDAQGIYPGDFWLNFHLAYELDNQKDHEGAIRFGTAAVSIRPNSGAAHNNLGAFLRRQKMFDEAIRACRRAIELDPEFAWAYNNLGNALHDQKKLDEAIDCYRKAIELAPKYAIAHANLGNPLYHQKKLDEAIGCYRKAIELDPKYAEAHLRLGNALQEKGLLDQAIICFRKAIDLKPDHTDPVKFKHDTHTNLGNAYMAKGQVDEAVAVYRNAIRIRSDLAHSHVGLGLALRKKGLLDEAIAEYREGIRLTPDDATAHNNLGTALKYKCLLDEAIVSIKAAIRLEPTDALFHANLGSTLWSKGQFDEAIAAYQEAIRLKRDFVEVYIELGAVLQKKGRLDEAIAAHREAVLLKPDWAICHNILGWALEKKGRLDEAIDCYRKVIELDPKFAGAYYNLGNLYWKQDKWPDAEAAYRQAIRLKDSSTNRYNLGYALFRQGKLAEAVAEYRESLRLNPKGVEAHHELGAALMGLGKPQEAVAAFEEAVRLKPDYLRALTFLTKVLTNCPDSKLRNPNRAVEAAKKVVELTPQDAEAWQRLGWAHYRTGDWKSSIAALEKSMALQTNPKGGDSWQWFFLAMAHWQMGNRHEARQWYDQAVQWLEKYQPKNEELRRFRAETEKRLGIEMKKD